jgi:hypothetical protein
MQTARITGEAEKLAEDFRRVPPHHSARNFHALNNSHFCECLNFCGNSVRAMVYSECSRMLCCSTFAAEGHAKANSLRVDIPQASPVSRRPIVGNYPKGIRTASRCKVALMKAPEHSVQSAVHRGEEFSMRVLARVRASSTIRDAVCANQQQQFAGAWPRELEQVCVPFSVRYTPL